MGARAPTLITGQLAPQRRQLPQLIERSAFVRSRRNGSSTVDQDIAAEPKIVAGAAKLVENGPRATDVAFERSRSLLGPGGRYFYKVEVQVPDVIGHAAACPYSGELKVQPGS